MLVRVGGALIVADDEHLGENLAQTLQPLSARPECLQRWGTARIKHPSATPLGVLPVSVFKLPITKPALGRALPSR